LKGSPVEIQKAFENIHYPANKGTIIEQAEEQGAKGDIFNKLYRI
jgi:hypothetical protein